MLFRSVFLAWMTITTMNSMYPDLAWEQWIKVSKIFLMILVAAMLISNAERLQALVLVIALVSTVFLREVPLHGEKVGSGLTEAPVETDEEPERERARVTA